MRTEKTQRCPSLARGRGGHERTRRSFFFCTVGGKGCRALLQNRAVCLDPEMDPHSAVKFRPSILWWLVIAHLNIEKWLKNIHSRTCDLTL